MTDKFRIFRILLAWIVVFLFAFPIFYWVTVAIKNPKDIFSVPPKILDFEPTLVNFHEVFGLDFLGSQEVLPGGGNWYMMPRLVDSIVIALGSTALTIIISIFASYALSRLHVRGRQHFVNWVLSTRMMPPVAVAIPMFFMFRDYGLMDTHFGIILVHALMNLPLAVLLLKSFFDDIPKEISESALLEGARHWFIFRRIILPATKGGVAATAVLSFIFSWSEFLFVLTLTQTNLKTVPVVSSTFVTSTGTAWGNMAALGTAAMVPAFIFIILVQKQLVRGLTIGSIK